MENEELELDLGELDSIEANSDKKLKVKNRIQTLSDKVKTASQERDEAQAKLKAEAEVKVRLEKERDFFKSFSQISSKYPNASSYQDQILERVNRGYEPEEAALAILAKEGKLQPITMDTQPLKPDNIAGGSASTTISEKLDKNLNEMSLEEKRAALLEMEKQGINLLKRD